jgi:hypothetical protein
MAELEALFQGFPVHIPAITYKKVSAKLVCELVKWFRGEVVAQLSENHIVCIHTWCKQP